MSPYCPVCLDVWCIEQARMDRGDWVNMPLGFSLHVSCGRALETIRAIPATYEFEPVARSSRWAP